MKRSDRTNHAATTNSDTIEENSKERVTIRIEDRAIVQKLTQISELEESTRKEFVQKLLRLLLVSEEGRRLQGMANHRDRSIIAELSAWMKLLQDNVPWEEVRDLATESQRYPEQMIVYLIRLGLTTYKRQIEAQAEAQGNSLIL